MGRKLIGIVGAALAVVFFYCPPATAQGADFDPEYDDAVAAGPTTESPEEAPIGGSLEASASASTESGIETNLDGSAAEKHKTDSHKRAERKPWEMNAHRHHSTLSGSSGLFYLPEAGSAEAGTFAVGVHGTYFWYKDYLYAGDRANSMWGAMTLRITPLPFLELYGSLGSSAMYNSKGNPQLFQAFGDLTFGLKGYYTFADFVTVGANANVFFLNPVGDVGATFDGTSFALDGLATFDFGALHEFLPGRLHLGVGYKFDNSAKLVKDIEAAGGGCGTDPQGNGLVTYKGCLGPDERTALGINRNDQIRFRTGLDILLPYVSPIVEYKLEVPVNRQDFICPKGIPGSPDRCMAQHGSKGFRQVITVGARVLPPVESLALDVGLDIGLTGYGPSVHELAAEAPWRILFGASYTFDPFPDTKEVPPPPAPVYEQPPPPPAPPATIAGFVHDSSDPSVAIRGAVVSYTGHQDLNPQVTTVDGRFTSYPMSSGPLTVFVKAEGYEEASFTVEIPETGQVALDCPLKSQQKRGDLSLQIIGTADQQPIPDVTLTIIGPENLTPTTDASGVFDAQLLEGTYRVRAGKEGYLHKEREVTVTHGKKLTVNIQLCLKPKTTLIERRKEVIHIKKQVHFANNSDEIKSDSFGLLDEIADLLIRSPEIKKIEIQGHTDNRGKQSYNLELSDRRALSIKQYLISSGVEPHRMDTKGYGPDKPIAPNVTSQGRARNRRVEFHILEQD
jgi:outer membrane protein OmpA-like peptidoglycan-associated protein